VASGYPAPEASALVSAAPAARQDARGLDQPGLEGAHIVAVGGERRSLQVATVADFAPQITEIDTSAGPSHFVLVTARDVNDATAPPVRFVMQFEQRVAPVVAGRSGRTL